uniref:Uncharacterized protein n=1 Tax=Myotis myotis TaxID=51298 RepID=A0A7J7QSI1_MYOMY|nr:hypothetical protein mMyoMyo1_012002 [Myotis myotis]
MCVINCSAPTSVSFHSQRRCLMPTSSMSLPLISEFLPPLCTPFTLLSRRVPFTPRLPTALRRKSKLPWPDLRVPGKSGPADASLQLHLVPSAHRLAFQGSTCCPRAFAHAVLWMKHSPQPPPPAPPGCLSSSPCVQQYPLLLNWLQPP